MTTLTRDIPEDPVLRRIGGDLLPATLGESLGATFGDPLISGFELQSRRAERRRVTGETLPGVLPGFGTPTGPGELAAPPEGTGPEPSNLLAPDVLNERFGHLGLSFERPTPARVAELMAEDKRAERLRQDIIARGPRGLGVLGLQLGVSLLRAALDPLNVAAAFVPVVSQARFAGLVARMGPTRARIAAGTVEGAVGNALVEPMIGELAASQQLDYTMADALVNVALGGFLGGGLHAVAGRVGDFFRRQPAEVREAALRGAIGQAVTGRQVDVEDIYSFADRARRDVAARESADMQRGDFENIDAQIDDFRASVRRQKRARPQSLASFLVRAGGIEDEGGEIRRGLGIRPKQRPGLINNRSGLSLDEAAARAAERNFIEPAEGQDARAALLDALDAEINRGEKRFGVRRPEAEAAPEDQVRRAETEATPEDQVRQPETETAPEDQELFRRIDEELTKAGLTIDEVSNEQVKNLLAFGAPGPLEARLSGLRTAFLDEVARREALPERDATADFEAADEIGRTTPDDPARLDEIEAEVQAASESIDQLRAEGRLTETDEQVIAEAEEITARADDYAAAARRAATCIGRP